MVNGQSMSFSYANRSYLHHNRHKGHLENHIEIPMCPDSYRDLYDYVVRNVLTDPLPDTFQHNPDIFLTKFSIHQ